MSDTIIKLDTTCSHCLLSPVTTVVISTNHNIELDWIEKYQWVDPPRLWEAVSGEGCIQMWSHFQLDSLFSPRPCTKVMGEKSKMAAPYICILPSDWPKWTYSSIQVQLYESQPPRPGHKVILCWSTRMNCDNTTHLVCQCNLRYILIKYTAGYTVILCTD